MNKRDKINRGRTGADLPPAMKMTTDAGLVAGSRDEVAHSSGRPPRVSMGNMKKLEISQDLQEDGHYYRWFQGRGTRIAQAKKAYFEHVTDEQGNNITCQSGPHTMYFMRLLQEYRDEDNILKSQRVAATMDTEATISAGEYAPDPKTGRAEGGRTAMSRQVM